METQQKDVLFMSSSLIIAETMKAMDDFTFTKEM